VAPPGLEPGLPIYGKIDFKSIAFSNFATEPISPNIFISGDNLLYNLLHKLPTNYTSSHRTHEHPRHAPSIEMERNTMRAREKETTNNIRNGTNSKKLHHYHCPFNSLSLICC
jgi:hypothetical protein